MKPTFLLFHAESVNENSDATCHLILIPVIDGIKQQPQEYFFNPEAPFLWVMSGITEQQVATFPRFSELWPAVQSELDKFDITVSSAEGYSARTIYGTLMRLGIDFASFRYCNAKAICRRSLDEVSYGLEYLSYRYYNDCIQPDNPVDIANRWCELALRGLSNQSDDTLVGFLNRAKITVGEISPDGFVASLCKRNYSNRANHTFDPSTIAVDADPDNPLFGMNVVFTGKMESMKRDDARAAVVRIGGNAPERLTQDTNYLVVGIQDLRVVGEKGLSGKMKTAAKYKEKGFPIEVIDERDFLDMLNENVT